MITSGTEPVSVLVVIYCALLVACAVTDFLWLRIPNSLVASLVALFFFCTVLTHAPVSLVRHIVPALGMFAFTVILFWFGKMPGGDVKLLTAATLWVGTAALPTFLIWLGIAGVAVTLLFLALRRPMERLFLHMQMRLGRFDLVPVSVAQGQREIPYGIVIAAASIAVTGKIAVFA